MASSTISLISSNSKVKGRLVCTSTPNAATNQSSVTIKIQIARTDSYTTTGTWNYRYIIERLDGTELTGATESYYGAVSSSWVTIKTISLTDTHDDNGERTLKIYTVVFAPTETSLEGSYLDAGVGSVGVTFTLDTISKEATIVSAPNFDDEDNPTITYDNPAGSAVTTLQAAIYNSAGTTAYASYRDISKSGTEYTFSLTTAERTALRNAAKNAKSITVKFYIKTVISGSTYYSSLSKTLSIVNANPTIDPTITDTNSVTAGLTGGSDTLIRYFSNAAITFGASALKGASIVSKKVECGSASLSDDGTINAVESGTFKFTVTDSRGNITTQTVTKSIVNYVKLTCGLANTEFNTDGVISFTIKGNYYDGSFGDTSNVLIVRYRYKLVDDSYSDWAYAEATISDNTYSANVSISGLDYKEKYVIQAGAIDELNTIDSSEKTMACIPIFDWGEDDFNFNVPVTVEHSDVGYYHTHSNTGNKIGFGVGSGGVNRGIYDYQINKWLLYYNDSYLYVNNGDVYYPLGTNRLLWSGAYYMSASQTISLRTAVSSQLTGIVLVFSRYDVTNSEPLDEHFCSHFIPKQLVALQDGRGNIFNMNTSNETYAASKYLYISDTSIAGHANNTASGTGNTGVAYDNSRFVLRYVIGV